LRFPRIAGSRSSRHNRRARHLHPATGAASMTISGSGGQADIGLVGLAVMGQNLVLNMADHGFTVAVYNRTTSKMDDFIAAYPPSVFGDGGGGLIGSAELKDFVASVKRPRKIVILVKAGAGTD